MAMHPHTGHPRHPDREDDVAMSRQIREPTVVVRGDVPDEMIAYASDKLLAVLARTTMPVLTAEVRLDHHADPARERPNHVELSISLDGVPVRARRSAPTMSEAIDCAETRLRRRVEAANERPKSLRLRHCNEQSWHHDDRPIERPRFSPRPLGERKLVRRKTFALCRESIEEALFDLETLDHDFFLFVHDETNAEAVVYRVGDGSGLMQRVSTPEAIKQVEIPLELGPSPSTTTLANALTVLDERERPFEFFVDDMSGHGMIAYMRYDGHYGLVLPS
jgi:ribosome-associated translation inhibitor RaiA